MTTTTIEQLRAEIKSLRDELHQLYQAVRHTTTETDALMIKMEEIGERIHTLQEQHNV